MMRTSISIMLATLFLASACKTTVKIEAPDKPITVNLNIKIDQEIRLKVEKEYASLLLQEGGLFQPGVTKAGEEGYIPTFRSLPSTSGLEDPKAAGLIGERGDGYLGLVDEAAPDVVQALVDGINAERTARYQDIAARSATELQVVEVIFGQKLAEDAVSGDYVMNAEGVWVRRQ